MKVLSVRQPWATLLVRGHKKIETRTWNTKFRGRLLIHASAKFDDKELSKIYPFNIYTGNPALLPLGKIIGEVTITGCEPVENLLKDLPRTEHLFGDYTENRFGWICEGAISYPDPIPAKGNLGLWEFPDPIK